MRRCDTKVPEERYGACIALADVLGTVLAQKTGNGYLTADEAGRIAENILYRNAQTLYKL